jgi:hypothetical protein
MFNDHIRVSKAGFMHLGLDCKQTPNTSLSIIFAFLLELFLAKKSKIIIPCVSGFNKPNFDLGICF